LYPLWYTPILPLLFYVSAIAVGLAMTIFESWHSSKSFGRKLETPLLMGLGRALAVALTFYLALRFWDMAKRGTLSLLQQNRIETWLFAVEIILLALPMFLLYQSRIRQNPRALYACSVFTVLGFVANRLDVGIAGMEAGSGVHYFPKWTELAVTLAIIAAGFAIFRIAAQHLPIFSEEKEGDHFMASDREELALMGIKGD
jgi:Ni/Fe-hydrogenase subunit HybB-like protein